MTCGALRVDLGKRIRKRDNVDGRGNLMDRIADVRDVSSDDVDILSPELEAATAPFVDRWGRLISQTNWEKGKIIYEWRTALAESGAPASAYADEVWSRQVGGVTPQHVGRLRRVYQRFGQVREQYPGLFWSHFQVALDWEDAEMWLEGAVQNGWSVAKMRSVRADTLGLSKEEALRPVPVEVELDEDFESVEERVRATTSSDERAGSKQPAAESAERHDRRVQGEEEGSVAPDEAGDVPFPVGEGDQEGHSATRPFADLPELPEDLQEALETFKLALLRHKTAGWADVRPEDVLAALDSLKLLVTAP